MVSLAPGSSGRRTSVRANFFTDSSINSTSTEEMFSEYTNLNTEVEPQIRSINTPWAIVVQLVLILILEVMVFVVPEICKPKGTQCAIDDFSILVYVHACVWVLSLILDRYLRRQHYFSRRNGYLEFYRTTRHIRRSAFVVLSGGNVVLTVLMAAIQDACPHGASPCDAIGMDRCNYLQVLISIESVIILPLYAIFLVRTCRFNRMRAVPDACQDEIMTSFLVTQAHTSEVGFRDEDYLDEVLEKQADMIRYLRQHNANLSKKILRLSTDLSARPR